MTTPRVGARVLVTREVWDWWDDRYTPGGYAWGPRVVTYESRVRRAWRDRFGAYLEHDWTSGNGMVWTTVANTICGDRFEVIPS